MRRARLISGIALATLGALAAAAPIIASADRLGPRDRDTYRVRLKGFEEVPAVVTGASGELRVTINEAAGTIAYQLGYDGLEGTVTQAHIHIAQPNVAGGIALWLCQTTANPAPAAVTATTPTCPGPSSGNVAGTLTAASVIGPAGQGVPAGALGDVIDAIRAGKAYGNVHSTAVGSGEIRGQILH